MSWFAQDDFRMTPTLTLSYGIRHEFQTNLEDKNNFAPRFGIAWSPFKDRKTTFRGGGGIFYSRYSDNLYANILRYDVNKYVTIVINNPSYPDPFTGDPNLTVQNTLKRIQADDLAAPYVMNFNGSIERQLPKGLIGSVTYNFTRGVHQFRSRNINTPDHSQVSGLTRRRAICSCSSPVHRRSTMDCYSDSTAVSVGGSRFLATIAFPGRRMIQMARLQRRPTTTTCEVSGAALVVIAGTSHLSAATLLCRGISGWHQ